MTAGEQEDCCLLLRTKRTRDFSKPTFFEENTNIAVIFHLYARGGDEMRSSLLLVVVVVVAVAPAFSVQLEVFSSSSCSRRRIHHHIMVVVFRDFSKASLSFYLFNIFEYF